MTWEWFCFFNFQCLEEGFIVTTCYLVNDTDIIIDLYNVQNLIKRANADHYSFYSKYLNPETAEAGY